VGVRVVKGLRKDSLEEVVLCDPQRIDSENRRDWLSIRPIDLGTYKVDVAARLLRLLAPATRVVALPVGVQDPSAQRVIRTAVGVVDAANTLAGRRAAIRGAVRSGIWIVSAGLAHDGRHGLVTLRHPARADGACAACLLPSGRVRRDEVLPVAAVSFVADVAVRVVEAALAGELPTPSSPTAWLLDIESHAVTGLVVRRRRTCRACRPSKD